MHDLLTEPLIGVRMGEVNCRVNLPELLAQLCAGNVDGYTGVRAHQADPWHVFLVQIAAGILARQPRDVPPPDEAFWRDGLLMLADGNAHAWHLVVEDVTQPAFLQHPWKSWNKDAVAFGMKTTRGQAVIVPKARTPDELDVLITSKNHDVKARRFSDVETEAWLYALMVYQTTSGYLGAGKYGIVRMYRGHGSRPIIAWVSELHPSHRFLEELAIVRSIRSDTIESYGYNPSGRVLTWLESWDRGTHQYSLKDLDPSFVEACRPVRLWPEAGGGLQALGATTKARQIGPKSLESGDVGDPWIPMNTDNKKGHAALTVSGEGFSPRLVTRLLFEEGFERTALQKPRSGDTHGWFIASVLVRGQGKTEGFHRLELPIPSKAKMTLGRPKGDPARQLMAECAQALLSDAKEAANALRTALTVLAEGGPEQANFEREAVKRWVRAVMLDFQRRWAPQYYLMLWRAREESREKVTVDWHAWLIETVQDILDEAETRLPVPSNRRWRAFAQARSALIGVLRKKHLWPETKTVEEDPA